MKQSLRLGTISGIPVGLNWGLLVIGILYLTTLATNFLPSTAPGSSTAAYWLVSAAGVAMFFGSILAHELGHGLVAQREGIRVRSITLWLLGGVAEIEDEAETPGAEFRIAAAGPLVSLGASGLFLAAGYGYSALFGAALLATMLVWLGVINALLAVFNLIPASPLDGGRILTAILWWRSGNPHRARATTAKVGQGFGAALVGFGMLALLNGGTFWLLILGWFLMGGATAERRRAELFEVASHVSVGEVMAPLASPTDSAVTASGLVAMAGTTAHIAFPVRGSDGAIIGLVPGAVLRALHPKRHSHTTASELTVPWEKFISARSDEGLSEVVRRLRKARAEHVLIYDALGHQVGYMGFAELARAARPVRT